MYFFSLVTPLICIIVVTASENLFEDWESSIINVGFALDENEQPLMDMSTPTTDFFFIPQGSASEEESLLLYPSEFNNDLEFNILSDDETVFPNSMADASSSSSSPADECSFFSPEQQQQNRVRRSSSSSGESCDIRDNPSAFPDFTDTALAIPATEFDRENCRLADFRKTPYFICSSADPVNTKYIPELLSWRLRHSTRCIVCWTLNFWIFIFFPRRIFSKSLRFVFFLVLLTSFFFPYSEGWNWCERLRGSKEIVLLRFMVCQSDLESL